MTAGPPAHAFLSFMTGWRRGRAGASAVPAVPGSYARAMRDGLGRRETNKLATREALQRSSQRLFAERGFDATTVRDIADGAGVTERTFFRYFAGKEELVVDQVLGWLPVLQAGIRERPAGEDPFTALKHALLDLQKAIDTDSRPLPLWLFSDGPLVTRMPRSAPTIVLKIESALAEAIRDRLEATRPDREDTGYLADLFARTGLALVRSVLIRDWQLRAAGREPRPSLAALIDQAFAVVGSPAPVAGQVP